MTLKERFQKKAITHQSHEGMQYNKIALSISKLEVLTSRYSKVNVLNKQDKNQLIHAFEAATKAMQKDGKLAKRYIDILYIKKKELCFDIENILDYSLMKQDVEIITVGCHFMYHAFEKKYIDDYIPNIDLSASVSGMSRADMVH